MRFQHTSPHPPSIRTLTNNGHNSNLPHEENEGDNSVLDHHFLNVGDEEAHHRASRLEEPITVDGSLQESAKQWRQVLQCGCLVDAH